MSIEFDMDPASLAMAFLMAQQGQFQAAVATRFIKTNADQAAAVAQLLVAGSSANPLANVSPGIGQSLDVSA